MKAGIAVIVLVLILFISQLELTLSKDQRLVEIEAEAQAKEAWAKTKEVSAHIAEGASKAYEETAGKANELKDQAVKRAK
jgi:predicted Holliday junction resolvase-like endonuclease